MTPETKLILEAIDNLSQEMADIRALLGAGSLKIEPIDLIAVEKAVDDLEQYRVEKDIKSGGLLGYKPNPIQTAILTNHQPRAYS
jgi:hypothetical protein